MSKEDLHKIVEILPDSKLSSALSLLQTLSDDNLPNDETNSIEETDGNEPLNRLLADLIGSLSSVLYDLSKEAEKQNDPILMKRFLFSKNKIANSWDKYQDKLKPK